jgi:hypothetical protein
MEKTSMPRKYKQGNPTKLSIVTVATIFAAIIINSCGGGSGGGTVPDKHVVSAKMVDSTGGFITVNDPNSDLFGLKLDIPSGAVSNSTAIKISEYITLPGFTSGLDAIAAALYLEPHGATFNDFLTITIPYDDSVTDDESSLSAFTYDEISGAWNEQELIDLNTINNIISARLNHFSVLLVMDRNNIYVEPPSNDTDRDGDGYITAEGDCNDTNPNIFPGRSEICDSFDNNCNGQIDEGLTFDNDSDGSTTIGSCAGSKDDCDDNDPNNFPGNTEINDGLDNNCNGKVDEIVIASDADGDGYTAVGSSQGSSVDCNDNDSSINPGAVEILGDGIDQNCDGQELLFSIDETCFGCHNVYWVNTAAHTNTLPPDATCAKCHPLQVNSFMPGHYGLRVKTAGNNLAADSIIGCTSCHDWHDDDFYVLPGANIVWLKVSSTGYRNLTCNTCHENWAALHNTDTVHDNRMVSYGSCGQCHTIGTNTAVDALHQSDCALCHAYNGTTLDSATVEQAIEDGINGLQVSCPTCHGNFTTIHQVDHSFFVTTVGSTCGSCHRNPPPLVDAGDSMVHNGCISCHNTTGGLVSLAAGKNFASVRDCTYCHGTDFDAIH